MHQPISFFSRAQKSCAKFGKNKKLLLSSLSQKILIGLLHLRGEFAHPRVSSSRRRFGDDRSSVLAGRRSCRFLLIGREPAVLPLAIPARRDSLSVFRSSQRETSGAPCASYTRVVQSEGIFRSSRRVRLSQRLLAFEFDRPARPDVPMCVRACSRCHSHFSLKHSAWRQLLVYIASTFTYIHDRLETLISSYVQTKSDISVFF